MPKKSLFDNGYPLGFRTVYNESGELIESFSTYRGCNKIEIGLENSENETGLLYLEIFMYSLWMMGDKRIRIK